MGRAQRNISAVGEPSGTARPINRLTAIASSAPRSVALTASRNRRRSPCTTPKPNPMTACISGATSMAPMITAGLLSSKPSAAMAAARPLMTKKSTRGRAPRRTSLYTSARSATVRVGSASNNPHHARRRSVSTWPARCLTTMVGTEARIATACGTLPNSTRSRKLSRVAPINIRS